MIIELCVKSPLVKNHLCQFADMMKHAQFLLKEIDSSCMRKKALEIDTVTRLEIIRAIETSWYNYIDEAIDDETAKLELCSLGVTFVDSVPEFSTTELEYNTCVCYIVYSSAKPVVIEYFGKVKELK